MPGQQVVEDQRAGRLAADEDRIAGANVLQAGGERAVGHLDAVELEVLVVVGAREAEGAQQRAALDLEPDHHEVAVAEAQARVRAWS